MSRSDTATVPNLRNLRIKQMLTQKQLATKAGVSEFTVQRAESGERITFATIEKIATTLSCSHTLLTFKQAANG